MPGEWCMVMGAAASALDNDASRACGGAVVTLRAAARPTHSSKHPALVLGDEIIDFRNDNRELGVAELPARPRARNDSIPCAARRADYFTLARLFTATGSPQV